MMTGEILKLLVLQLWTLQLHLQTNASLCYSSNVALNKSDEILSRGVISLQSIVLYVTFAVYLAIAFSSLWDHSRIHKKCQHFHFHALQLGKIVFFPLETAFYSVIQEKLRKVAAKYHTLGENTYTSKVKSNSLFWQGHLVNSYYCHLYYCQLVNFSSTTEITVNQSIIPSTPNTLFLSGNIPQVCFTFRYSICILFNKKKPPSCPKTILQTCVFFC